MGLSKQRWEYLKAMPPQYGARVSKDRVTWGKGRRPAFTYRAQRYAMLNERKRGVDKHLKKERWAIMMLGRA